MLVTVDDPAVGPRKVVGNPIKIAGLDNTQPAPPPRPSACPMRPTGPPWLNPACPASKASPAGWACSLRMARRATSS